MPQELFVGIDVLARLDVALRPTGEILSVTNDASGIAALAHYLFPQVPTLIVCEATSGLEHLLASTFATCGLPIVVVNARLIRNFARSTGRLAKTDVLDAQVLAQYAQAVRPTLRPMASEQQRELAELVERRRIVLDLSVAEKNRRSRASQQKVRADIASHLALLDEQRQSLGNWPTWSMNASSGVNVVMY